MTSKSRFRTAMAALALGTTQGRDEPMWNPERVSLLGLNK